MYENPYSNHFNSSKNKSEDQEPAQGGSGPRSGGNGGLVVSAVVAAISVVALMGGLVVGNLIVAGVAVVGAAAGFAGMVASRSQIKHQEAEDTARILSSEVMTFREREANELVAMYMGTKEDRAAKRAEAATPHISMGRSSAEESSKTPEEQMRQ